MESLVYRPRVNHDYVGLVDWGPCASCGILSEPIATPAYIRKPFSPSCVFLPPVSNRFSGLNSRLKKLMITACARKHKPKACACLGLSVPSTFQQASAKPAPNSFISLGDGALDNAVVLRPIYIDFLESLSYSNTWEVCHPHQYDVIADQLAAMCDSYIPSIYINTGSAFADLCFKFHPPELKVKIAHFGALLLLVDDLAGKSRGEARVRFLKDLSLFQLKYSSPEAYARLFPGRGDLHPALEAWALYLKSEQSPFLTSNFHHHATLVKCVLDFMQGNAHEQHYQEHPLAYTPEMLNLPKFLRYKAGLAEPFAYFLFAGIPTSPDGDEESHGGQVFFYNHLLPMVPDLIDFVDRANDVLSFYKEIEEGEENIVILSYGKMHSVSPLLALKETVANVVELRKRVMALADKTGSADAKRKVVQFFEGYLSFHVGHRRYRLEEVLGSWYACGFEV